METLKIIHFILGKAHPERMNGVSRAVFQLASAQHRAGMEVAIWGVTPNPVHDYPERPFPTLLFQAGASWKPLDSGIARALEGVGQGTVFHLHGGFVPDNAKMAALLRKRGFAYVLTAHGSYNLIAMERSAWRKWLYINLFERKLLRGTQKVHLLGKSEAEGLLHVLPGAKYEVIPNGFILPEAAENQEGRGEGQELVFGFVGRIDTYTKGLDLLTEGYRQFCLAHPGAATRMDIVGDGPGLPALRQTIQEQGITDKVALHGSKFGEEKEALLRGMDVFFHPSRNEGIPTAVLEAASLGIPVVVSEATNVGDAVRAYGAGIVLEANTADALASAMAACVQESGTEVWQQRRRQARAMVAEAFDWGHIAQEMRRLYTV